MLYEFLKDHQNYKKKKNLDFNFEYQYFSKRLKNHIWESKTLSLGFSKLIERIWNAIIGEYRFSCKTIGLSFSKIFKEYESTFPFLCSIKMEAINCQEHNGIQSLPGHDYLNPTWTHPNDAFWNVLELHHWLFRTRQEDRMILSTFAHHQLWTNLRSSQNPIRIISESYQNPVRNLKRPFRRGVTGMILSIVKRSSDIREGILRWSTCDHVRVLWIYIENPVEVLRRYW